MFRSDYHIWIDPIHPDVVKMGLTKDIVDHIGEIMHIDLPSKGSICDKDNIFVVVESSKSAIEVQSPLSGEVIEVNANLTDGVELLNSDPEGKGWIVIMKLDHNFDANNLF